MNISGVVVRTAPEHLEQVVGKLRKPGLCNVHFKDEKGIIIVTVEGKNTSEELEKIRDIQNIPNVLFADLAYSYNEREIEEAWNHLKRGAVVPAALEGR